VFFLTPTIQAVSDIEREIEELKQAIRINPDDVDAHYNLGAAYGKLGMHEEAIEAYRQAIRINPYYINAHYNLGLLYNLSNDKDSALVQYEILKSLDTEWANRLFNEIYK
jgi:tetratricopeptide (TPR) repeat protein